jgi:hypothetical protein
MKRELTLAWIVCASTAFSACGTSDPAAGEAIGETSLAVLPPYCWGVCDSSRRCDKECRLDDETIVRCIDYGVCEDTGDPPPDCSEACTYQTPCETACRMPSGSVASCRQYDVCDERQPCPELTFSISPSVGIEPNQSVTFTATTLGIAGLVNWDFGDAQHCVQCPLSTTHAYAAERTYYARLTAFITACDAVKVSDPMEIVVGGGGGTCPDGSPPPCDNNQ